MKKKEMKKKTIRYNFKRFPENKSHRGVKIKAKTIGKLAYLKINIYITYGK